MSTPAQQALKYRADTFSKTSDTKIFKRVAAKGANKVGHFYTDLFNETDKAKGLQTCFLFEKADNGDLRSSLKSEEKKRPEANLKGMLHSYFLIYVVAYQRSLMGSVY